MIAVIADDITGAAEMAGIAHRLGLRVSLTMDPASADDCDVLVIATDTRSMSEDEAAAESRRVGGIVGSSAGVTDIFKKTDSALRGHVVAELEALLDVTRYSGAIYLPANPSKKRVIDRGVYYIDGVAIDNTDFSFDPEFPATSAVLAERFPDSESKGIVMPDAVSGEDVEAIVNLASGDTLLAGAADLFTAFISSRYPSPSPGKADEGGGSVEDTIIVCGSTQSRAIDCGLPTAYMPTPLYDGVESPERWIEEISAEYVREHGLILAIRDRHRTGKEVAVHLRTVMAEVVAALVEVRRPRQLIIEGGATAFAILSRLGWRAYTVTREISPGVIRMRAANGTSVIMKPGSYPWGNLF